MQRLAQTKIRTRVTAFVRALARDESGQAITEYVLLLSVLAVTAAGIARALMSALDTGVLKLGGQLERDLRTGRVPLNVWEN